jgi:hypothetical protein
MRSRDLPARQKSGRTILAKLIAGLVVFVAADCVAPPVAYAGPPFVTDDPEPVETGHWEIYGFSDRTDAIDDRNGTLAGVEINYGAAPNLQLHFIAPLAFDQPRSGPFRNGIGDLELGVKYRFIDPRKNDWWPQVAVFPLIEVPTGDARKGLGAGAANVFLPVWMQKDFGQWTTYGGGGYWINPGVGNKNWWFAGWLLQRRITEKLSLGGELFYQTPDEIGEKDSTGFNLGGVYDLNEHYHLLFSAGRGLQNMSENRFSYYLAFQYTF